MTDKRTDLERLLDASIQLIERDIEIELLKRLVATLKEECVLLKGQVSILAYKRAQAVTEGLSCLLMRQAD
jgi:hypothetical protein